ncbi:MAG: U32 family peptidase [Lachnospiraceae bacterium]|nr:U32 family peptidase [Lachnospiraceae bacterium]
MKIDNKVELLAPAGDIKSLYGAIAAGANAIYLAGEQFGARAFAKNFETEDLIECIRLAHIYSVKIYLTVNTLMKDMEIGELVPYLTPLYEAGLDGIIVQDFGVLSIIEENFPDLPVHGSTQMTVTSSYSIRLLEELGVSRIVLARELSLKEIKKICKETKMEIETFIHGSLCYAYSGQCLFSSYIGGRSGNRGRCGGICRLPFKNSEGKQSTILSLKDLNTLKLIPEMIEAGIKSFKIEGRMKSPDYVYTVVSIYRKYIDLYLNGKDFKVKEDDILQLEGIYKRRGYDTGYYLRHNGKEMLEVSNVANKGNIKEKSVIDIEIKEKKDYFSLIPKIKINVKGEFKIGENPKLTFATKDNMSVTYIEKSIVVEKAKKTDVSEESIRKQLNKLGSTTFQIKDLVIEKDENIFVSLKTINQLRRDTMNKLVDTINEKHMKKERAALKKYLDEIVERRNDKLNSSLPLFREYSLSNGKKNKNSENEYYSKNFDKNNLIKKESLTDSNEENYRDGKSHTLEFLITSISQYNTILKFAQQNVGLYSFRITLEYSLAKTLIEKGYNLDNNANITYTLALPMIFRDNTYEEYKKSLLTLISKFDVILIRNFDEYVWLRENRYKGKIIADKNIYIFNKISKNFIGELYIDEWTGDIELNSHELSNLGIAEERMIVYGYQGVMVTANCIAKSSGKCLKSIDGKDVKFTNIVDRMNYKFPVKLECDFCYNVIYNHLPLNLMNIDIEKTLNPFTLVFEFTVEDEVQTEIILKMIEQTYFRGEKVQSQNNTFTYGHFKRGVE